MNTKSLILLVAFVVSPTVYGQEPSTKQVVEKNYRVGEKTFAYVGDPVVKVKDYWIRETSFSAYRSSQPFEVSRAILGVLARVQPDTDIPVAQKRADGTTLVQLQTMPDVHLVVGKDGKFTGKAISGFGMPMGFKYKIHPEVTLTPSFGRVIEPSRGFTNFEILYGGISKDELKLSYREYTPDDMARAAFAQELTYSPDSKTVRFKKVVLHIESADNERIIYTVVSDGL